MVTYTHGMLTKLRLSRRPNPLQLVLLFVLFVTLFGAGWIAINPIPPAPIRQVIGAILSMAALVLFWLAARQHVTTKPCAAFSGEAPARLVTSGPYRHVRHPIYSAYLLSIAGLGIYSAHPFFAFAFVALLCLYSIAAFREEAVFLRSKHRQEYQAYRRRAGCFSPKIL